MTPAKSRWFRADLDGLRAVAILIVVAFHARVPGFGGGFVGVDVFFVISGYLITTNILRETQRSGRLRLLRFWARRIRRLVPALALVVIATMIGSLVVLSNFEVEQIAHEGLAATLYISNVRYAIETQGYFATEVGASPFLHTWSLGVEEQFYLVWPVLVGLVILAVRRRPERLRLALGGVFVVVLVVSFLHNLSLTGARSTWAFYGLPARAWEFAAAGLLATVSMPTWLGRRPLRMALTTIGLGLIALATVRLSGSTAYPGAAALLPVVGSLMVIVAGDAHHSARLLASAAAQWIGRISYSWYLWHWPVIILSVAALGEDTAPIRTVAAAGSLLLAWLAFHFFENPIRLEWKAIRPVGRTMALGAALTVAASGVSVGAGAFAQARPRSPVGTQLDELDGAFYPICFEEQETAQGFSYCVAGDGRAGPAVALVGDSKAATWFNVLAARVPRVGGRLALVTSPGCPFMDVELVVDAGHSYDRDGCLEQRADAHAVIEEFGARYVVIAQANVYLDIGTVVVEGEATEDAQVERWGDAFEQMIMDLRADGREPIIILDNPALPADPRPCIARNGSIDPCELSTADAMAIIAPLRAVEMEIVDRLDVLHVDAAAQLCDAVCHLGFDDYLVYVDSDHLSHRATERFGPELEAILRSVSTG